MKSLWTLLATLTLTAGCATAPKGLPPLELADPLSLDRYMGEWYVIANIPYFFERGDVQPRVIYRQRNDGRMDDLYFFRERIGGPEKSREGVAWVPDPDHPAAWKVRFIWPFTFDYRIIAVASDYRYAAIAHPSRDYAWIMARAPRLSEADYESCLAAFAAQGYDVSRIVKVPQSANDSTQDRMQSGESS